ncbi:CPBP family intramembrane glutamic endopeptidase [Nocardioides sp. GXQ0305]|uniref:CPBP family intramembrane glutamic endopeptidase n=1 Tax=Nocardioides sp. GXQ0305 TaxID=3423912 RepID=UPI003D7F0D2F
MTQPPFPPGPPRNPQQPGPWPPPRERPFGPPPTASSWPAPQGPPVVPPYTPTTPYGAAPPAAPPAEAAGRDGVPYHLLLRAGWHGTWWRGLIGIVCLGIGMVLVLPLIMMVPFVIYYVATGADVPSSISTLVDLTDPTPASLAYLNLSLAGLIPLTWVLVRWLHGLRPRWLSSIRPRLRWGYLLACFGLSFVALLATVLVASLLPTVGAAGDVTGKLNEFTPEIRDFVLVVLLLTPLQAAAEEYAFRGYLLQAFGGIFGQLGEGLKAPWLRHPVFAVVLSSFLFALAHGAGQDIPIFFDRFAFGIVAATLVVVTGGLEAGIAMHVLNNWLAFGAALAYGDMGSALNPTGGTWWSIPVTLTQSLVYLGLAWWVARAMGIKRRTDPAVLAAPETRV